ncbi:MAG: alpha/beta hydrolase [Janthinobacterium lividum]
MLQIPSRNPGRSIKVNVYKSTKSTQSSPVLLNLHGSGFILPGHGSDDEFCARVARETDYTVLDMRYRLAPENPFPAALNDVQDAVNWVLKQPDEFNSDRFAISGFSAGGNLALAAAGGIFRKDTFRSILAFYPSTNKSIDPADRKTPDTSGKASPVFLSRLFDECYIPPTVDKKNPLVSPSFAQADAFPKNVLFITAACDNLCLEAEALAARIESADGNRNVVRRRMEKCGHAWDKTAKPRTAQEKAKDEAYSLGIDMLRE